MCRLIFYAGIVCAGSALSVACSGDEVCVFSFAFTHGVLHTDRLYSSLSVTSINLMWVNGVTAGRFIFTFAKMHVRFLCVLLHYRIFRTFNLKEGSL